MFSRECVEGGLFENGREWIGHIEIEGIGIGEETGVIMNTCVGKSPKMDMYCRPNTKLYTKINLQTDVEQRH